MRRLGKILRYLLVGLAALALLVVIVGLVPDRAQIPAGEQGRHVELPGAKLRYHQVGSGPDLLLIHGLPGTIEDWKPLVPLLSSSCRMTFIDRPGHGYSSAQGHRYNVEHNARVALELIDRLGLKNVTVVGHSYGGAVSMGMAVRNPPAVRAFVLVGAVVSSRGKHPMDPEMYALRLLVVGPGLARLIGPVIGPGKVEAGVRDAFHPNEDAMPPGFIERAQRIWLTGRVAVTIARERSNVDRDLEQLEPRYGGIRNKLVLVHGKQDRLVSVQQAVDLHRKLPATELVLLDGVGHYVQFARPAELARVIRRVAATR